MADENVTTVQISRETSKMLDEVVKASGIRKGYLADTAIKFFLDPELNPGLKVALLELADQRTSAEAAFVGRLFRKRIQHEQD